MTPGKKRKVYLITLIIVVFSPLTIFTNQNSSAEIVSDVFFEIDILSPSYSWRYPYPDYLIENMEQIGIKVDDVVYTGWPQIYPRTWGYNGSLPIPIYDKGGFDTLFIGFGWGFEYAPFGLYDSQSIPPQGYNFYQYSNPEMDWAIYNYTNSYCSKDRAFWGAKIQELLYRDIPTMPIVYPTNLHVFDENLTNIDLTLWDFLGMSMANWVIPNQTEFRYAYGYVDFEDFHPYSCQSMLDLFWLNQIYTGLFERQPDNHTWQPEIAIDYNTSNGLNWTVSLDPNARWADGTPLTAWDIKYSYDLQLIPECSRDHEFWSRYLNNESIVILDNYTLQFNFKQSYTFQDSNFGLSIIPYHIWNGIDPADFNTQAEFWAINDPTKLLGAGSYYLHEFNDTKQVIHLKRNPYYGNLTNKNNPYFDDIYFEFCYEKDEAITALISNEVDMLGYYGITRAEAIDLGLHYDYSINNGVIEMAFNNMHPFFGTGESCPIANPDSGRYVRKAISHIFNREKCLKEMFLNRSGALPASTTFPMLADGFDPTILPDEFSIETARNYMELAGFEFSKTNTSYIVGYNWIVLLTIIGLAGVNIIHFIRRRKE
ncbi:MAG: ABC transporter substrate-binding protein [Candidatus Heimdallarchaeota archaeon]